MMKSIKYICASFLILVSGMMSAQNDECQMFDVDFTVEISTSSDMTGKAVLVFQNKAFTLAGNGFEAYCDGASLWVLDMEAKEVSIDSVTSEVQAYVDEMSIKLSSMKEDAESSFISPEGQLIHIKVNSMKKTAARDISSFRPSYEFDSSWVVTDLR